MEIAKQLAVVGVLGLIIGAAAYIFIKIQARTELWQKAKWERENANLSSNDLEVARQAEYGKRLFPGVSNKFLFSLVIVVALIFVLAEFGLLKPK
jgi:hypothetical protein